MRKRLLLAARYYSIEPLGILYLAGLARDCGWECRVVLVREFDFQPLYDVVLEWKPDLVGFQIWTGYHVPAFAACDAVRSMGVPVVIGGPHATYFHGECIRHADHVIKGTGFGLLSQLLRGDLKPGIDFDKDGRGDRFPLPDRDLVYEAYSELGASPIKSMFGSTGCPMECTYCYAPSFNEMHGGFKLFARPVDDLIAEAKAIKARWPLQLIYFQDDIFGYNPRWLEGFARRWKAEVGVDFHCQIRAELAQHDIGNRRLDLFKEAGCTGITLAIESGNAFLRDRVLYRHMHEELIVDVCQRIMQRGMTLRTEQILGVPFSNTGTDLSTVHLNSLIGPIHPWASVLAPYAGTHMGTIAKNFGFYEGDNDDLTDSFFDRSVLRHPAGGPRDIEPIVAKLGILPNAKGKDQPLAQMHAVRRKNSLVADVFYKDANVGTIEYLSDEENKRYCDDTVRLQRLFNFLPKVPETVTLAKALLALDDNVWSWQSIGKTIADHLHQVGLGGKMEGWKHSLAREMHLASPDDLPEPIRQNPWYFCFFPAGGILAQKAVDHEVFSSLHSTAELLDALNTLARRHLFHYGLYKIETGSELIAA